jgi:hypothetical protein
VHRKRCKGEEIEAQEQDRAQPEAGRTWARVPADIATVPARIAVSPGGRAPARRQGCRLLAREGITGHAPGVDRQGARLMLLKAASAAHSARSTLGSLAAARCRRVNVGRGDRSARNPLPRTLLPPHNAARGSRWTNDTLAADERALSTS